eukprot:6303532-Pyramimonas_sp.AAC.1
MSLPLVRFILGLSLESFFAEILDKTTDSRPWPHGIPYSAWKASGEIGAGCLSAVYRELVDNQSLPPDFNDSAAAFLPKGNSREGEGTTRSADETRPPSLSNMDNKLVSASIGWALSIAASDLVQGGQKGFLKGRQMIDNIIEVDANMMLAHSVCDCRRAGSAVFDLKAAFPSIYHGYMRAILRAYGIPEFIIHSIVALYENSRMVVQFDSSDPYYIHLCRGIKQGCPLS